jgi:hypothetical protein
MWIQGYSSLINTESLRAVDTRMMNRRDDKWELCALFHSLDFKSNQIISVHDTEELARAAQGRLLRRLQERPAKGIGLDKDALEKLGGEVLTRLKID